MELRVSTEAEEDIEQARAWFDGDHNGVGERFDADVLATLRYIEAHPGHFQVRFRHYRYAPLTIFRYHVIYSVEGPFVVVHRVRHMHRRTLKRFFGK